MRKEIIILMLICVYLPMISAFDSELTQTCGGDSELIIECVGEAELNSLGFEVTEEEAEQVAQEIKTDYPEAIINFQGDI